MALYPGDPTKGKQYRWRSLDTFNISDVHLHSTKMPLENRVWYEHSGNVIASGVGPEGRPAKIGRVLDDGSSQIYRYEYNSKGNVTRVTDPVGRETLNEFDTNEIDLVRVKQKNGSNQELLLSATYNAQGQPLTTTDAAGQTTTYTYNAQGQILTVTTPPRAGITENRTTTHSYDSNGVLQSITGPAAGETTSFTYDGYGRTRTVTNSDGYTLTYDYDPLDRITKVTYPDGTYEETVYNRLDAEKHRDRLGRWSHTFYDPLRRASAARDALGRTTTQQWCTCGSLDKLIDANGNATAWERDVQGRVTREVRADGAAWEYTFEATTGRLKQVKDAKNQVTSYEYFRDDNLKQTSYSGGVVATPTVSFTYDPAYNRRASMTDGTGTTSFSYHPITVTPPLGAGQLATIDGPLSNDTVTYSYDELGRVVSRGLSGFTITHANDALGRLTTIGSSVGNFGYTYDGVSSRPLSLGYPNGQTTTHLYFGNAGDRRLQQIKHLAPGGATLTQFDYTYDALANIKSWRQQYGTSPAKLYELGYDSADQLTVATLKSTDPTPVVLKRYGYGYDSTGNRTSEQVDDAVVAGSNNNRDQLHSRQPGGALAFKGTLNEPATVTVGGKPAEVKADNTFQGQATVPSGTSTVQVQAQDPSGNVRTNTYQVSQTGSTTSYSYDSNGNLTSDGTRTYEWDAANRLVRVTQGATELARFVYDGLGRRAQKIAGGVTRTYVYDGEDTLEERLTTGTVYRYVHGPGIDEPLARTDAGSVAAYYLADHLASVVQETSATGAVTLTREYDPYGNLIQGASTSGYAFAGREWDVETALYYYRARYYTPEVGRFISEDPARSDHGLSLYTYVRNNPLNYTDPLGTASTPVVPPTHSIPGLTTGQPKPRGGERGPWPPILIMQAKYCVYIVVGRTDGLIFGGAAWVTRSRIRALCGKPCVDCPEGPNAVQVFTSSRGIITRINIDCSQV
jgi:RHS repeat-associated protein